MTKHKKELLERLRQEMGCDYISDLRYAPFNQRAIQKIRTLDREEYGEAEWSDAIYYLEEGEGLSVKFRI